MRNVMIAVGNSGDRRLAHCAQARLRDQSPLIRAMAVWALGRLLSNSDISDLAKAEAPLETDSNVLAEWKRLIPQTASSGVG